MRFIETILPGVSIVEPDLVEDERGFFARIWCGSEWRSRGLSPAFEQCSISHNHKKGTLRGIHFQAAPHAEAKLISCVKGSIFDVIVDLRPGSPTYLGHVAEVLSDANRRMIYAPEGCGHAFLTLEDNVELFYQITAAYVPEAVRGIRWDDPWLAIPWPLEPTVISARDRNLPPVAPSVAFV